MGTPNSLTQTLIADERRDADEVGARMHSDALLQAARRVDWRFLLPEPELGRVACLGPARGTLPESLRLFSASLTVIETPQARENTAQYDVVVASGPSDEALRQMVGLVRPGGFLYVEACGPLRPGRLLNDRGPRPRFAADYLAAVERHGFVEARAYWHWPNFESCHEIIPLDDRTALLHALTRRGSDRLARLKSAFGWWLVQAGVFARTVPCFSVVARKEG